jgi:N-acyl-D-amino-acid deacylase
MPPRLLLALGASLATALASGAQAAPPTYDVIIRHGVIYDGSGHPPVSGDVAISGDSIAGIGDLHTAAAKREVDAHGRAVAPGFINMLSGSEEALVADGHSQSDIRQGVTLEVFGEGGSMGPLSDTMKKEWLESEGDIKYPITWTTLDEFLRTLEKKGTSTNVASFIGATTVRIHELGYADRPPTAAELARMQALVRAAMRDGAMGVGSSLIYAPAFYAKTDELIALSRAAGEYGGLYISHMRSEGNSIFDALGELIRIAREAGVPAEIYHLKVAGQGNWWKLDSVIAMVNRANASGLKITANMYTYTAGATGLDASMPPWVQEGGYKAWAARLRDPEIRARVRQEMRTTTTKWENLYLGAGSPDRVLLIGFKADSLKYLTGKTLAQVAAMRGTSPEETAMDLVVQDGSRVSTVYFIMDEANVQRETGLPWVSFCSDESSLAPEGVFLLSSNHPRAFGNFARFLGRYVRDRSVVPLEEAVRRLSALPATNLKLRRRGLLRPGYFADIVIFDPATIQDHATYEKPQVYSTGVSDVFVNGVQVIRDGEHTGATPGRVVRGPGWTGWSAP